MGKLFLKKRKGSYLVEAAIVLPVVIMVFTYIILVFRFSTLHNMVFTSGVSAMEVVNSCAQIVNNNHMLEILNEGKNVGEAEKDKFVDIIFSGRGSYQVYASRETRQLYKDMTPMSLTAYKDILTRLFLEQVRYNLTSYVSSEFGTNIVDLDNLEVSSLDIVEEEDGTYFEASIGYKIHFPFAFIKLSNTDFSRTCYVKCYIE